MKRKFLQLCLISGLLSLGSCAQGDIDDLQDQMDDLTEQVAEMEKAQQEALLTQIAQLQTLITGLQSENAEQAAEYEALLVNLQNLQAEIEANAASVYYGDATNADQYAALAEQSGATIITGNVIVNTAAEAEQLANIYFIGGDVVLNVAASLNVSTISGSLEIQGFNEVDQAITLTNMTTVGGYLNIRNNEGLISFVADNLKYLGGLLVQTNPEINNLSMTSLAMVTGDLKIDNYVESEMIGGESLGKLVNLDINGTNVGGKADILYIPAGGTNKVSIGSVWGNLYVKNCNVKTVEILGTEIGGEFEFQYNKRVEELLAPNLVSTGANLAYTFYDGISIKSNGESIFDESTGQNVNTGLKAINFDNLESVGAKFTLQSNKFELIEINTFNKVTEVVGDINVAEANEFGWINMFNGLVTHSSKITMQHLTATEEVSVFNSLTSCDRQVSVEFITANVTAFTSMTYAYDLKFDIDQVTTTCEVLNVFEEVKGGWSFKLYANTTDKLCSMSTVFDLITAGTFVGNVSLYDNDVLATDNSAFITAATAGC